MEDLFELLVAAIVIIAGIASSAKKQKKQQRPGKGQPVRAAKPKKSAAPVETLGDIEEKIDDWMRQMEQAAARTEMEPARLEPEPMIPESMEVTPLEQAALAEGMSRVDDMGCIGGSLEHDAQAHHQGMDFHAGDAHGRAAMRSEESVTVERVKPRVSAEELRKAVIWKEILDAPVSLRD